MANFTRNAASALFSAQAVYKHGTGAEAMAVSQPCRFNTSTGKWELTDCSTAAGAGTTGLVGIVAAACSADGQPVKVCIYDPNYKPGFTVAIGTQVVLSDTEGELMPDSDLTTGEFVTVMMFPISTTNAILNPVVTGVAVA